MYTLPLVTDIRMDGKLPAILAQRLKYHRGLACQQGGVHGELHRNCAAFLGGGERALSGDLLAVLVGQYFAGGFIHEPAGDGILLAGDEVGIRHQIGDCPGALRPGNVLAVYRSCGVDLRCTLIFHRDGLYLCCIRHSEGQILRQQPSLRSCGLMQGILRADGQSIQHMGRMIRHPFCCHMTGCVQQLQGSAGNEVPMIVYLGHANLCGTVRCFQRNDGQPVLLGGVFGKHIKKEWRIRHHIPVGCRHFNGLITPAILQLTRDLYNAVFVRIPGVCIPVFHRLAGGQPDLETHACGGDVISRHGIHLHHPQVAVEPLVIDLVVVGLVVFVYHDGKRLDQRAALPAGGLLHGIQAIG